MSMTTMRRALLGSSFSPRAISGSMLWLDGDDRSSITIATGVSVWRDKSGLGNDVTQPTGAAQPTFVPAGQNSRSILRVVPTQYMSALAPDDGSLAVSALTGFVVAASKAGRTSYQPLFARRQGTSGGNPTNYEMYLNAGTFALSSWNGTAALNTAFVPAVGQWGIFRLQGDQLGRSLHFNGASQGSDANKIGTAAIATNPTLWIGGYPLNNEHATIDLAEYALYNRVLDASESAAIELYLKSKWGL